MTTPLPALRSDEAGASRISEGSDIGYLSPMDASHPLQDVARSVDIPVRDIPAVRAAIGPPGPPGATGSIGATAIQNIRAKVWNVEQTDGVKLKVATLEHGERNENPMCDGCHMPYCCHALLPVLTGVEFTTQRFQFRYVDLPEWLAPQLPNAQKLAVLAVDDQKGCPYLNGDRCSLWPNPPAACLGYDCREEERPDATAFCLQRTQEWMKEHERSSR